MDWRARRHLHVVLPVKEVDMIGLHLCDDDTRLELGAFLNGDGREQAPRRCATPAWWKLGPLVLQG